MAFPEPYTADLLYGFDNPFAGAAVEFPAGDFIINDIKQGSTKQKLSAGKQLPDVLFVEDNTLNAMAVKVYLKKICKMDHAKDGLSALDLIKDKSYKVILMDINLGPGLNGIEVMKEIRKIKEYKLVPIIAVTGYAASKDREILLGEGFDHYLAKPFEQQDIANLVKEALMKYDSLNY